MKTSNNLIDITIEMIGMIESQEKELCDINKRLQSIYGEFYPHMPLCAEKLHERLLFLLDSILGDGMASYYLYERPSMGNGGKVIEANGKDWPITTLEELKAYCEHINK